MEYVQYLGDAVYATHDDRGLVLMTGSHLEPTNTIVLEPAVLDALDRYRKEVGL